MVSSEIIPIAQPPIILTLPFRAPLRPINLPKRTRNRRGFKTNLAVPLPIDITHQHIHVRIIPPLRHRQHILEVPRSRQQAEETPQCAPAEGGTAYTFVGPRAGDFDHADAAADVDEEVGVASGGGGHEGHGVGVGVGEDFVRDLGDEEIEACSYPHVSKLLAHPIDHRTPRTYYKTLHLIFAHNLHPKRLFNPLIVLVSAPTRSHHTQIIRVALLYILLFQPPHEFNTGIYLVCFELEEIETASCCGTWFRGEVDEFGEGTPDLLITSY